MRWLVYLTLGFGTGCAVCVYASIFTVPWQWISLCIFLSGVLLIFGSLKKKRLPRKAGAFLLGLALSLCWFQLYCQNYLTIAAKLDGRTELRNIRASDYSRDSRYGAEINGITLEDGKIYRVKVYLKNHAQIVPGSILSGTFQLQTTISTPWDMKTSYPGKGILLVAYQQDDLRIHAASPTWWEQISQLRQIVKQVIQACFPEDTQAFAKALVLGDTSQLDYQTDTALKVSGIRHIAAVSGLHVSVLFALVGMLGFRRRFLTFFLGIPSLFLFAALAGFTPSVSRACLMAGLMLLAQLVCREYDAPTALAFASIVMLIANPMVITSISFQLSVASVGSILLFSSRLYQWMVKGCSSRLWSKWIAASVSISLSSYVLTIPFCARYFGTVSILGPLTNLLTLWAISLVFYGILIACLIFWFFPAAGVFVGSAAAWLIRYILFTAQTVAKFPLAAVYTCSTYIVIWLIFVYALLIIVLLCRRKQPMLLTLGILISLIAAVAASWVSQKPNELSITVLDVGQGQCILIRHSSGCIMVDCGGDSETSVADLAAQTLLSQGIFSLDGLILTHYDQDHIGAVKHLLSRIPTDVLILPKSKDDGKIFPAKRILQVQQDVCIPWGNIEIQLFAPTLSGKSNEESTCVLFDGENCAILITGDQTQRGEQLLAARGSLPNVDILVVGHHGSATSTSMELLQAVQPKVACISVGKDNPYGHPAQQTLDRLRQFGCIIYRTDINGTILIRR